MTGAYMSPRFTGDVRNTLAEWERLHALVVDTLTPQVVREAISQYLPDPPRCVVVHLEGVEQPEWPGQAPVGELGGSVAHARVISEHWAGRDKSCANFCAWRVGGLGILSHGRTPLKRRAAFAAMIGLALSVHFVLRGKSR